jgi:multiple sugar transport system permease protein
MTTTAQIPLTIIEPEKRSKGREGLSRALVSYSFLAPWLIGFLGLTLGPTLASLYLSFTNFDLLQDPQFI